MKPFRSFKFTVNGKPVPQGDLTGFCIPDGRGGFKKGKGGWPIVTMSHSNEKRLKPWRRAIARAADIARDSGLLLAGRVRLTITYYFKRPGVHYSKSKKHPGRLLPSAPRHHCQIPDCDKLNRAVCDALTGHVYTDDKLVHFGPVAKEWTEGEPRADILVEQTGTAANRIDEDEDVGLDNPGDNP